jgi:GntR family transcriptional regulator
MARKPKNLKHKLRKNEMIDDFINKYQSVEAKGLPKYVQFREALRDAIQAGFWKPGMKLPPEIAFAEATPFSLGTVQKALYTLAEEGVIVRLHGKGTYVPEKRMQMDSPWHNRFAVNGEECFLPVYPKILLRKRIAANDPWAFLISPNGSNIVQIDRKLGIGDDLFVYSKFFVNGDKFKFFLEKSLDEIEHITFKTILKKEYNISITHVSFTLKIIPLPVDICAAIEVKKKAVGILNKMVASSAQKIPIYYQELYVPQNDLQMHISENLDTPVYWI